MSHIVVPPYGPAKADLLVVGERPGRQESQQRRPFCGDSGKYQADTLARYGVDVRKCRLTNVCQSYAPGNADPAPADIDEWTSALIAEVKSTAPLVILCVGRYAMRFFLGDKADFDVCWGTPFPGGAFDSSIAGRANGAVVMCVQHPARIFHLEGEGDPKVGDVMANIEVGYERAAHVLHELQAGRKVFVRRDEYLGREQYEDVTGKQLESILAPAIKQSKRGDEVWLGFDTEGYPGDEWSMQASIKPGTGYLLRRNQPDFSRGVASLQRAHDAGVKFLTHSFHTPSGCAYDIRMARGMGLTLHRVVDTMCALWLLNVEGKGAKDMGMRWAGMAMTSWEDTVGQAGREKQIDWLCSILNRSWPDVEQRVEVGNDGQAKLKKPWSIPRRVEAFLIAIYAENKSPTDCWKAMDPVLKKIVETEIGMMPMPSLDDLPLRRATDYACRDSDALIRAWPNLRAELARQDKLTLLDEYMATLPIFEEMQANGMPASRLMFEQLHDKLTDKMDKIRVKLSNQYASGRPFNPNAQRHVVALMTRRGLESAVRTKKTNQQSIGKKGIEHLRYQDEAMALRAEWKETQHIVSMYANPVIEMLDENVDIQNLICAINPSATTTGRIATNDPNYLGFPKHDKIGSKKDDKGKAEKVSYGKMVRGCFIAPSGWKWYEADYSQIEVRVLAHESNDDLLCRMFTDLGKDGKPRDVHQETAASIFGVKVSDIDKDSVERFLAKKITFGIAYGTTGRGLADQLRIMNIKGYDADVCNRFINEWLKLYKGAARYFVEVERAVRDRGWVEDFGKMRRYLLASRSRVDKLAAEARRQAVNHRIQGGAQRMIQRAMPYVYPQVQALTEKGAKVKWLLQVHDALLFLVRDKDVSRVDKTVKRGMVEGCGVKLRVPVTVDSKTATSWGAL